MPLHSGASFSSGAPAIMASIVQCVPHRTRVAMRSASSRQRLDLGSIFGARHQSSRTPPVERHGTPRNRPTRTGRQQAGHPIKTRGDWEPGQQRQPSRGRGTRGPRSIGLFLLMKGCAGWGGGRRADDAGLPMRLGHWMCMWRWPCHAVRGWTGCMALSERWSWPWTWALI